MAAITITTLLMYQQLQLSFFKELAIVLLGLLTLIIATLLVKTVQALRKVICVDEQFSLAAIVSRGLAQHSSRW
jgi:tellurite resistance protein